MTLHPAVLAQLDQAHARTRNQNADMKGFPMSLAPVPVLDDGDRLAFVTVAPVPGGYTCQRSGCYAEAFRQIVVTVDDDGGQWCAAACPEHTDRMTASIGLRRAA